MSTSMLFDRRAEVSSGAVFVIVRAPVLTTQDTKPGILPRSRRAGRKTRLMWVQGGRTRG
jgi:hypothetical protein